jgi:hypothetical protein
LRLRAGASKHLLASDCILKGPQEISEGRSCSWLMAYGENTNLSLDNIKHVWACDETGKMYRGKFQRIE